MSKDKKNSLVNWEDSYFGGFRRVLSDYPEIKMEYSIDSNLPNERDDLTWYTGNKLVKLLHLRIKEMGLAAMFLDRAVIIEKPSFFGKKKYLTPVKISILTVVDIIISKDSELGNLFRNYRDILGATEFLYPAEPDKKKGDDAEEGCAAEEKCGKSGEEKQKSKGEIVADAVCLIDKTMKYKDMYDSAKGGTLTGDLKKNAVFKLMRKSKTPTVFTDSEVLHGENLAKMLDISFDLTHDKIPNLQSGKIDVAKIATVPAGNSHVYFRIEEDQATKPFSVCILCDESGSMTCGGFLKIQQELVKILYLAFSQKLPLNKIFIYGHSGSNSPEIRIYNDAYNTIFLDTIEMQKHNSWSQNYDGPVIEAIHEKIRETTSDSIIFIAISDGVPAGNDYGGEPAIKAMKQVIEKCKRDRFVTIGIGLQLAFVKEIYNYYTIVTDMSKIAKQVSTLVNHVVKVEFQS